MAIGTLFAGKYRLERQIGDGGMGTVFEAVHEMLGTRVAIKILHRELLDRSGLVDRFLQEAKVAAEIHSPHVVQVSDVGKAEDGSMFMVMELLQGEPLSSVLDREGKLPAPLACEYVRQILVALEAAHALNVTHRDLKPENVFLTMAGGQPVIKLIDFGIAKLRSERTAGQKNLTVAGVMMGTAEYMAPEQAFSADQADARSDVYSAGVMLYEMLSGTRPVTGADPRVIATRVVRGEATPLVRIAPEVRPELAGLVHRAMAPNPDLRFTSAANMRIALEALRHDALDGPSTARIGSPLTGLPSAPHGVPAGVEAVSLVVPPRAEVVPGTGTVMGAPVPAALAAVLPGSMAPPQPMHSALMHYAPNEMPHAPPGAPGVPAHRTNPTSHAAPAMSAPAFVPELRSAPPAARRPKKTPLWPFLLIALILGAAAVVVFVVWQSSLEESTPPTPVAVSPTAPAAVVTAKPSATADLSSSALAPLTSVTGLTPVAPPPSTVRPSTTATPTATAVPTGPLAPTAALTLPSQLPTALPPFPTALPTSFPPFPFPPAPK